MSPDSRKKVIYILHNIEVGGVEVALLSAIPALNKKYNLQVIVLGSVTQHMIKHLDPEDQNVFRVFNYPIFLYPLVLGNIVRHILKFKPDVVICSLWRATLTALVVKSLNTNIKLLSFNHNTRLPHFLSEFITKLAISRADRILADSTATKLFLQQLTIRRDIEVVSFITEPTPKTVNKALPRGNDEIRFMFLGRINKIKNLDLSIRLIKYLREKSIAAVFDIYGRSDKGEAESLTGLATSLEINEYITFKGEVNSNERTKLFENYHFYIQLSSFEGMAMSVVEAMQHGLVSIVSPVGEIEHYARDMHSAVFVDIDQHSLAENDLEKIMSVMRSSEAYERISLECHSNFLHKPYYKDSLIKQIEKVL